MKTENANCEVQAYAPEPTILWPLAKKYPYEMNGYVEGVQRNGKKAGNRVLRGDYGIMVIQE